MTTKISGVRGYSHETVYMKLRRNAWFWVTSDQACFSLDRAEKVPPFFYPPVRSDVIMCHAINVSQSDFTGNYLHVAIQGKTRRKRNRTLAGMSAQSDFIHTIKGISANLA